MYKVFIDNISKTYHFQNENELLKAFGGHKFIEAAGGVVSRGDQYLFIKRNGLWDIPKGKREKGESVEHCAVREIEEECGLVKLKIIRHLLDTWHTYELPNSKKVIKKTYWYLLEERQEQENLIPQLEEGITEASFFKINDFEQVRANTYESIQEVMDALLSYIE